MPEPLHVLVYGPLDGGSCCYHRIGVYQQPLLQRGIDVRPWTNVDVQFPESYAGRPLDAVAADVISLGRSELDWADVLVLQRYYFTTYWCDNCSVRSPDRGKMLDHAKRPRHVVHPPREPLLRWLVDKIEHHGLAAGQAIVYETDDDLFSMAGSYEREGLTREAQELRAERDLIERMMRLADLVTVATPVLETRVSPFNGSVRVVRNAVDPALYITPKDPGKTEGEPRVLYYGTTPRRGDYEVCRSAVNRAARAFPGLRRVWLGSDNPTVRAVVDEAIPYVAGVPEFAAALVRAQPHIGLAPVLDEPFNRARSELHWLEYTLAGAATIASRTSEPGPYDAIRDGSDGLLASSPGQWLDALMRLASSSALREELVGRALERVLADYTVERRADEWADAYRWAADHAGRGRMAAESLAL